jgi:nitrite reductase (NO-forming)
MHRRVSVLGAALFSVALLLGACSSDGDTTGTADGTDGTDGTAAQTMAIADFAFDPDTLTVPSGQDVTIEVTNNDDVEHSFTLDDDSVSQDVEGGESQTVTLNLTEGIGWHCEYHPDQMKGTITVS